jgi:hypothetical protein
VLVGICLRYGGVVTQHAAQLLLTVHQRPIFGRDEQPCGTKEPPPERNLVADSYGNAEALKLREPRSRSPST